MFGKFNLLPGGKMVEKLLVGLPEYHTLMGEKSDGLIYLMMNLPTACSYHCQKYALANHRQKPLGVHLSADERRGVIQTAKAAGIKTLVVIGNGEPTENFPLVAEVISAAHENGLGTILFSTLGSLTDEQIAFFTTHNVSMIVSLDSLNQQTYRWLTGGGDLPKVLANFRRLREAGGKSLLSGRTTVRLGVNTMVCAQNLHELTELHGFCGDDVAFFANPPMARGRLSGPLWRRLVTGHHNADEREIAHCLIVLQQTARQFSETGGPTSLDGETCGYFSRGVSVDVDGEFLACGYANETAGLLGNVHGATTARFQKINTAINKALYGFCWTRSRTPHCPVRDPAFREFVAALQKQ